MHVALRCLLSAAWLGLSGLGLPALAADQPAGQAPEAAASGEAAPAQRTLVRFLTDDDYPPFNYLDEDGNLTGFNVDFARAVCVELEVTCDVRAARWAELLPSLERGEADAVIASVAITPDSLAHADFTARYYFMPGRFAGKRGGPTLEVTPEGLESRRIGVVKGTAHQAYIAAFFQDSVGVAFDTEEQARAALTKGEVDLLFGDGLSLAFWINGSSSAACCELVGGPFQDERYFGQGVGIAVRKGDALLKRDLDKAIAGIMGSSRYEELLLRYFPQRIF